MSQLLILSGPFSIRKMDLGSSSDLANFYPDTVIWLLLNSNIKIVAWRPFRDYIYLILHAISCTIYSRQYIGSYSSPGKYIYHVTCYGQSPGSQTHSPES